MANCYSSYNSSRRVLRMEFGMSPLGHGIFFIFFYRCLVNRDSYSGKGVYAKRISE